MSSQKISFFYQIVISMCLYLRRLSVIVYVHATSVFVKPLNLKFYVLFTTTIDLYRISVRSSAKRTERDKTLFAIVKYLLTKMSKFSSRKHTR